MKSEDVVKLLKERYCFEKGFVTLAEVGPPGGGCRYDALAVSVFPSHGFTVDGFEIKVARSDFLAEIENPAKSAPLAKWCDRWWMVCPPEVGKPEECPKHWGFLSVTSDGLRKVRHAKAGEPAARGDAWWATMLLRLATKDRLTPTELSEAKSEGWREGYEKGQELGGMAQKRLEESLEEARKAINDFEAASGVRIDGWDGPKKIGDAVAMLLDRRGGFFRIAEDVAREAESLAKVAAALKDIAERSRVTVPRQVGGEE